MKERNLIYIAAALFAFYFTAKTASNKVNEVIDELEKQSLNHPITRFASMGVRG